MRRRKSRANRRIAPSSDEDEAGLSKVAVDAAAGGNNESEKAVNQEIDCFKEEFEEVDNVVSAVMEMDSIQLDQINNGDDVVENKSNSTEAIIGKIELNLELNSLNGVGESEESDNLDVSLKCSKFEDGSARGQNLSTNIEVVDVDSGNEIEDGEEAKDHGNEEQKSIEGEPLAARITITALDGHINDCYSNKDGNDGENEKESRDDCQQNEDIEVSDVNIVPQVLNHDCLTKQRKEKTLEIHVGGLHKMTVEQDLFEIFGKFGEVQSARIVRHQTTQKSKGFAFIQYATAEQAKKVLSDLKNGIEVKGKLVKLSISHDRDVLYLGHICKTWTKEDILGKLKGYGIVNIVEIQVPKDSKNDKKIKGFAFLRFKTFFDAKAALHHLRKPDVVFGNLRCAKVSFARTPMQSREKIQLQVKTIYVEGVPKSWDVHKLKEICEQYAETKKVKISRNLGNKGKDFGFISFTTRGDAVACVKGMNKLQYEENAKVKAYIARPLVRLWLWKGSCVGWKFNRRHRNTDWWKIKGHARSNGAGKEIDVKAMTDVNKSKIKGTEEKPAAAAVYKNNQDPLKSEHTIEGKTNEQQSIAPDVRDAGAGLSTKPKKTDVKRKTRKRERDRTSQGRHSHSSRSSKRRSHVLKGHRRDADSIAYRIPFKEAYAASTSGHPGSGYGAISGSKRPSSYLEPHVGYVSLVNHNHQYHAEYVTPFHHQRQTYTDHLKLDTHYERQPPVKYFKPAIGIDALPHAGFLEFSSRKQSFSADDYPARRIPEYSGPDNQGPVHGAGYTYSRPYVPNYTSSAGYEGYHRFNGAYHH
ncbi:F5O11.10, putative isoform 1 [Hibiscus syriacus]|uniref:F5O11.10, putative isoform 1 n=1 Tax=Hibiscus syriacus TaxID=106335 RepID=A0A6A3C240_HIBSY|nr:F5O11.10, putative isoform 1 [Hibiscus syriacus]